MPENEPQNTPQESRRDFLRLTPKRVVGAALATAAVAGVATSPWWLGLPSDKDTNPRTPLSPGGAFSTRDLINTYADWLEICIKKKAKADKNHKRFYIVIGEQHTDPECFLLQAYLTDVALRLGLSNRLLEIDDKRYGELRKILDAGKILNYRQPGNMALNVACEPRGEIIPIDSEMPERLGVLEKKIAMGTATKKEILESFEYHYQLHESREDNMANTMLEQKSGIAVVGTLHLHEVVERLKTAGAEVAVFSGESQKKLTTRAKHNQSLLNTLGETEKTPAIKWLYQQWDRMKRLGDIAILAPDKILDPSVREPKKIFPLVKGMLAEIETTIGDLHRETDLEQIRKNFEILIDKVETEQQQRQPAQR